MIALPHLDLLADRRHEVGDDARRRARSARAPSSSLRPPRGAGPPRPRRPPRHTKRATRPFIGARTPPSPSSGAAGRAFQRIDQFDIGLPAAGEGVDALWRLEQGRLRMAAERCARGPAASSAMIAHRRSHAGVRACRRSVTSSPRRRAPTSSNESATPQGSYGASGDGRGASRRASRSLAAARTARWSGGCGAAPRRERWASMKPVSNCAGQRPRGCASSARKKPRLVFGPITTASSSSLLSILSASARVGGVDDQFRDHRIVERASRCRRRRSRCRRARLRTSPRR